MDFTDEIVKMAGALALVVLLLLSGLAVARRLFGEHAGKNGQPLMRVLGGLRVGTGKQIMVVDVAGEVLVLGTTAREMTLLTKITDQERANQMRVQADPMIGRLGEWIGQWSQKGSAAGPSESGPRELSFPLSKCS